MLRASISRTMFRIVGFCGDCAAVRCRRLFWAGAVVEIRSDSEKASETVRRVFEGFIVSEWLALTC